MIEGMSLGKNNLSYELLCLIEKGEFDINDEGKS